MRKISYALLIVVILNVVLVLFFFKYNYSSIIVQTTHGPVESVKYMTIFNQKCHIFKGIPYAAPPITGIDPYTGQKVDRRFKVCVSAKYFSSYLIILNKTVSLLHRIVNFAHRHPNHSTTIGLNL